LELELDPFEGFELEDDAAVTAAALAAASASSTRFENRVRKFSSSPKIILW